MASEKAVTSEQPPPYSATPQQEALPYPQQPQAVTATVIAQPTFLAPLIYGPAPMTMTCPHCQAQIVTSVDYETGMLTWLVCGGIALFGCWCGCCLIPFCMDDLQDCRHTCPNCKNFLGVYRRI